MKVCRESCAKDLVPHGHYERTSSQKNSQVRHKCVVEDQGMERNNKSTSAPQQTLRFYLSLNGNRDSGVISNTMVFLQGRGLTVCFTATSTGGPFWPLSHRMHHSWSHSRSNFSSACSRFLFHGDDVDMPVTVHTPESNKDVVKPGKLIVMSEY